jgi:hypothetical protein
MSIAQEKLANKEAAELILPAFKIKAFTRANRPCYRLHAIATLAKRHRLHPSLVLGQLQYRREVSHAVGRVSPQDLGKRVNSGIDG